MSKEMFMAAHEELVEEYMADHPEVSWREAYDLMADAANDRMRDKFADMIDLARLRAKEGR